MIPRRTFALAAAAVVIVGFFIGGAILTVFDLKHEVDQLADDRSILAAQLENEGIEPAVPDAEPAPGIPGEKGDRGDQGPTGPQGPAGPEGPEGPVGKDGAAGPIGPKGDTGAAGADGTDGVDGSNGVDGTNGVDGQPGADGRGIASQDCVDGDMVTTFTDGTTSVIPDSPACPNGPPVEVTVP